MIRYISLICACTWLATVSGVLAGRRNVGGGVLDGGWHAEYFANPGLEGPASFTRRDVRIMFDWDTWRPIGGSPAEPYRSFPRDGFSVRWTGRVMPRFSEPYTFAAQIGDDEAISVKLRPQGGTWQTILNGNARSEAIRLEQGKAYDMVLEYREKRGAATCILLWSSPSTPEEVLDPVVESGLNVTAWDRFQWADMVKDARLSPAQKDAKWGSDENKWPETDFNLRIDQFTDEHGQYMLLFKGRAEVDFGRGSSYKIEAGGKEYAGTLPSGAGYDAASNTTRAVVTLPTSADALTVSFSKTSRDGSEKIGTGTSNVQFLRPVSPGGVPHPENAWSNRAAKRAFERYTCMRYLWSANFGKVQQWSGRLFPTAPRVLSQAWGQREAYEAYVIFSNETGKDLYITLTGGADDEYMAKIAKTLVYGSDGREPYDGPTDNPVFPPLNPNLRVYIEVGNEMWNWAFGTTQRMKDTALAAKTDDPEQWKIINFDGALDGDQGIKALRRYHVMRTVGCSKAMRRAFGDAGFDARVRMLLEYQYRTSMQLITQMELLDGYYNNGVGKQYVTDPHPYSYYIWGGGGATYYGVGNPHGEQDHTQLVNGAFDQTRIADGSTKAPNGHHWTFEGEAGLYRNSIDLLKRPSGEKQINPSKDIAVGYRFRVGDRPIFVSELGRYFPKGARRNSKRRLMVLDAATKAIVCEVTHNAWFPWNARDDIRYVPLKTAAKLAANHEYLLLSVEPRRAGAYLDVMAAESSDSNITLQGAVTAVPDGEPGGWTINTVAEAGKIYPVPLMRFRYSEASSGFPDPVDGSQLAWLNGKNAGIIQTVRFERPGAYAVLFDVAGKRKGWPGHPLFHVMFNEQSISFGWKSHEGMRLSRYQFKVGEFNRGKNTWGSDVFEIREPGEYTISFRLLQDGLLFLDNLRIVSADALIDSGLGSGQALGQVKGADYTKMWTREAEITGSLGLPWVSYESGWSVGGDHIQVPIQNWTKCNHPKVFEVDQNIVEVFQKAGGYHAVWGVYTFWPSSAEAFEPEQMSKYPLVKSLDAANQSLPHEPTHGLSVPGELKSEDEHIGSHSGNGKKGELKAANDWSAWLCLAPETATYAVSVNASEGAVLVVEADGQELGLMQNSAQPETFSVRLTKGQHGIRVRCLRGACVVRSVSVK